MDALARLRCAVDLNGQADGPGGGAEPDVAADSHNQRLFLKEERGKRPY